MRSASPTTIRFISPFSSGYGNDTEEREALFGGLMLADIFEALEQSRGRKGG